MNFIRKEQIQLVLTGASGSTKSEVPINGILRGIHIDYGSIVLATTDVTVKCLDPDVTLLTASNTVTAGWYSPKTQNHDNTGAPIAATYQHFALWGEIEVSAAQSAAGTITVTLLVER